MPIYDTVRGEVEKSRNGSMPYSTWRNYDDLNEYFWSRRCFETLKWPINKGSNFFVTSDKVVGKTGFVEQRSFLNVFRSFDKLWILLVLFLQVAIVVAWKERGDYPWDALGDRDIQVKGGLRRSPTARRAEVAARSSGKRRDGWSCRRLLSGMMLYGCGGGRGWLRGEVEKSRNGSMPYSTWRNYDDLNEYFWSRRCFETLKWPINKGSNFFVTSDKVVGKTGFVEQRSFLNVFRSFDKLWILLVLFLQVAIVVAWKERGDYPWDALGDRDIQVKIFTGNKFYSNKNFAVYKKTSPRSDLRWKPTGRIFKSVGFRWLPKGKLFDSCTSKVGREPTHGFNADISNIHECKQLLDLSAGTSINVTQEQSLAISAGILWNVNKANLRVCTDPGPSRQTKALVHNSTDPGPSRQTKALVQNSTDPGPSRQTKALVHNSTDPGPSRQTKALVQNSTDPGPSRQTKALVHNSSDPAPTHCMCSISASTTCFGSAWFHMILPGYTSALLIADVCQIADVFGCLVTRLLYRLQMSDCRCVWLPGYTSALQIADVFSSGSALVCMHMLGLHRNETPSNTESALWDAAKLRVCFSDLVYFVFDKLPMFTAATL
nr:callose synthase 12-like [Tanacetum cinerariifolium]